MRSPWEDTIIVALRDLQWIDRHAELGMDVPIPSAFIKLDSTVEQTLGDLLLQQRERFYLFEVKSSETTISTEWLGRKKKVFNSLARFMKAMEKRPNEAFQFEDVLWTSLRCHHIAYWSEEIFDPSEPHGTILAQPYLTACSKREAPGFENPLLARFLIGEQKPYGRGSGFVHKAIPVSALRRGRAHITEEVGEDGEYVNAEPTGLSLSSFLAYLDFLLRWAEGGSTALNAIICSDEGIVERIRSVHELRRFLVRAKQKPMPSRKRETHQKQIVKRAERMFLKTDSLRLNLFPNPTPIAKPHPSNAPRQRRCRP